MDAAEITKALTETVLVRVDLDWVRGDDIAVGNTEKLGEKVGQLYKGILTGVVDAIESIGEKESK